MTSQASSPMVRKRTIAVDGKAKLSPQVTTNSTPCTHHRHILQTFLNIPAARRQDAICRIVIEGDGSMKGVATGFGRASGQRSKLVRMREELRAKLRSYFTHFITLATG